MILANTFHVTSLMHVKKNTKVGVCLQDKS